MEVPRLGVESELQPPAVTNPTSIHEDRNFIFGPTQWVKDLAWLWLWPAAVALIGPLAWEPPYASGVALKRPKKKIRKTNPERSKGGSLFLKKILVMAVFPVP